jgi:hypothetical protein
MERPLRNKKDYPNYPRSSRFLWHGAGKEYYHLWEDFLEGRSDYEPPAFWDWIEERKKKKSRLRGIFRKNRS